MSEHVESDYRVIIGQDGEFDLFDLEAAAPAIVSADPALYEDEPLRECIETLRPGNRITATLEKTDEIRDTGLFESPVYRFVDIDVQDRTRTYHGFGDLPIVSSADRLVTKLTKHGAGIGRATISDDEMSIGRVVVFNRDHPSPAEPIFETELQSLREFGEPPFYVFQTATEDGRFFVHYYLVTLDAPLAQALLRTVEQGTEEWNDTKPPHVEE